MITTYATGQTDVAVISLQTSDAKKQYTYTQTLKESTSHWQGFLALPVRYNNEIRVYFYSTTQKNNLTLKRCTCNLETTATTGWTTISLTGAVSTPISEPWCNSQKSWYALGYAKAPSRNRILIQEKFAGP